MGHTKIVDLLLKEGVEVDAPANSGVTTLWLASGEGKVDVMKSLLKKDADANNARSDNISALMTASAGGHAEAVKLLVENGADARFADGEGVTPLMNAGTHQPPFLLWRNRCHVCCPRRSSQVYQTDD